MSVGILLITHDDIGASLIASLRQMLGGTLPLAVEVLSIRADCEPMTFCCYVEKIYQKFANEQGILILTDLFGATPCNIACSLRQKYRVRVVCGVNLPMLVKVMNYASSDLDGLADKAVAGGTQGILDVNNILNS